MHFTYYCVIRLTPPHFVQAALLHPLSREGRWGASLLSRLLVKDKGLRDRFLCGSKDEALPWPLLNVLLRGTLKAWFERRAKLEEVSRQTEASI